MIRAIGRSLYHRGHRVPQRKQHRGSDKCQEWSLTICTGRLKRDKSFWKRLLGQQLIGYARCSQKGSTASSSPRNSTMTLSRFVRKNAFRNKRRSLLTILSIAFPLLLLSFLMSLWRAFYGNDLRSDASNQRLIVRHKVSLTNFLPMSYEQKIRAIPGVAHIVPMAWFQGVYKDEKPENFFARFGTDPNEFFDVYTELSIPPDQLE